MTALTIGKVVEAAALRLLTSTAPTGAAGGLVRSVAAGCSVAGDSVRIDTARSLVSVTTGAAVGEDSSIGETVGRSIGDTNGANDGASVRGALAGKRDGNADGLSGMTVGTALANGTGALVGVPLDWGGSFNVVVAGASVGAATGALLGIGDFGAFVGTKVGETVGDSVVEGLVGASVVGEVVGTVVGPIVGSVVGDAVGTIVGPMVGSVVGDNDGSLVGPSVSSSQQSSANASWYSAQVASGAVLN